MIYTFHRTEGFYPIEYVNDMAAAHAVLFNPGTKKVINEETWLVIFDESKKDDITNNDFISKL